jgi:hypothetical protein
MIGDTQRQGMMTPWRRLALLAALNLVAGAGVAAAQTVIVRNAPAGAPVEITFNSKPLVKGTADQQGDVTLPLKLPTSGPETDVRVFLDSCGDLRRVVMLDRFSLPPSPDTGCERRDVVGLYVVRPETSLMIDVGPRAAVWLRQGPLPKQWMLADDAITDEPAKPRPPAPKGIVLSAGGLLAPFSFGLAADCGEITDCSSKNSPYGFSVGAGVWLTRFLGIEGTYARPRNITAKGSDTGFSFEATREIEFFTLVAKAGFPIGQVRFYGLGGINYHRSNTEMSETIDETTVTIDDVATTVPGGTWTYKYGSKKSNWIFGGGMEVWVSKRLGIFGEISRVKVSGGGPSGTLPVMDDRSTFIVAGLRLHLGR